MATSKIYQFCSGGTYADITITLTPGTCDYHNYWTDGSYTQTTYHTLLTFTSDVAPTSDVVINFQYTYDYYHTYYGGSNSFTSYINESAVLPAGNTTVAVSIMCSNVETYRDPNDGRMDEDISTTQSDFIMLDQFELPVCGQPTGCTLEITSYTINPPTQRGLTDGSIVVEVTGATGSTITYKLNGATYTTTGSTTGYTYTNLAPGVYNVLASEGVCFDQILSLEVPNGEFRTGDFTLSGGYDIMASDNPIIYNVGTAINNPYPTKGKIKFTINSTVNNNDKIVFALTSPMVYNQTFYSKGFPNKSNYFLASILTDETGANVGTNSATEIATSLAQSFENDSLLPNVYYIENSGNTVTLTARETGSKFNLDYGTEVNINASGITYSQLVVGVDQYDGQLTDNYNVYCEVFLNENSGNQYPDTGTTTDYQRITQMIIPFSTNNQHKFNLSDVLKTKVSTPKPDLNVTSGILPSMFRSYFCKFGEIYPLVPNTNTSKKRYKLTTTPKWVINSSLSRYVINDMSYWQGETSIDFGDPYKQDVPFLTNSPSNLRIERGSKQYLYFILQKDYCKLLTLHYDLYFNDGTSSIDAGFVYITTSPTNAGGVMYVDVSYNTLLLNNFETSTKKIQYFDLYINQTSSPFSVTKRYYLNNLTYSDMFGVHFENELGGYDTFDFIGVKTETIDREVSIYEKPLNYQLGGNLLPGFKSKGLYDNKVTKKVIGNTGWITSETFDWLIELMKTNNVYCYTEPNQPHLIITDVTYESRTDEELFNITCTFTYSITENNVSM